MERFDQGAVLVLVLLVLGLALLLVWASGTQRRYRNQWRSRYLPRMQMIRSIIAVWHGPRRLTDQRPERERR